TILLALPILLRIPALAAQGFIEEVSCSAEGLTVMLNRSAKEVIALMNDPKAQPVAYVYAHKSRVQCGTSLKNEKGAVNYNLTIPYGKACDVQLTHLEPSYRISETTIVLENNVASYRSQPLYNAVNCVYSTKVQTYKFTEFNGQPNLTFNIGGRPKPKVDMLFRSIDGTPLREARVGELLEFYLTIQPDNAYRAILPKECMFSDREDMQSPETHRITFVQGSCPVDSVSEIIDKLQHVNQEVFFSKFKTFRFRDQSTVFVHCTAQVCMTKEECATTCFKQITNSTLNAERLRFRHKRSAHGEIGHGQEGDVDIIGALHVLPRDETAPSSHSSSSISSCSPSSSPLLGLSSTHIYLFSAILLTVSIASIIVIVYLLHRLKRKNKESTFDLYSAAQLRSIANSSASLVDRYPGYPLHVHTAFH
ncbi:hypothetical protein PENTCL1PPCAC_25087, partial [Pristionchus entomophagus]